MQRDSGLKKVTLSSLERHQVRTQVAKDALALASISAITILLAITTYFLFGSYQTHRKELADRWYGRGQQALKRNQPLVAVDDLHSALLYAPGQRSIEVTLASALASAGKIQEATAYFNSLWETEPGNGEINVQLARLSARSGNEDLAKRYYHAAIYGNWEGDGYLRRPPSCRR
jgi:predicted Zn-dependent protease